MKKRMIVAATSLALCGNMLAADKPTVEEEAALRVVAYSATLARFVSTNSQAFVVALAPSIRGRWLKDEEIKLRVDGVQLFLPDFFKVAYVYNGGVVRDAFCFGLYNPFYDHMLLCKAKGVRQSEIVDYKGRCDNAEVSAIDRGKPARSIFPGHAEDDGRCVQVVQFQVRRTVAG